jgi:hypothetical protein
VYSPQDLQLRAHLRWVASADFGIKVRAQTSLGIGCTVEVGALEIDLPVWIQVILQVISALVCLKWTCYLVNTHKFVRRSLWLDLTYGLIEWSPVCFRLGQPDLKKPVTKIQLAATSDPKINFGIRMGDFRCLLLLILFDGTPDTEAGMVRACVCTKAC